MGFSVKKWEHEKSKNYCSCEPTHAQIQPEKPHGVSGSHCEAQRQNLLCSRSDLSRSLNHEIPSKQPSQLRCCLLGRDRGRRNSLRLDRGSPGEASIHQVRAQDDPSDWISTLDQLGNIRVGQGSRCQIRCRVEPHYRSRNFKSCPGLGQLQSSEKSISYKQQASSVKRQAASIPSFS